jgi:para-aminobenzoate synthetase/4-amino-4-deoxychorismate lyase
MILLDDAYSTSLNPSSRLYGDPLHAWCIKPASSTLQTLVDVEQCLNEISQALGRGEFVVCAFAYELGNVFHQLPSRATMHPIIQAWSFDAYEALSKEQVDDLIAAQLRALDPACSIAGIMEINDSINETQFNEDIGRIQEYIRSGDTYQINHTYRINGKAYGSPFKIYSQLRKRQPGQFGAYIDNAPQFLLSQSPELFVQRRGNLITAMPMKGTASALHSSASELSEDPKNRAENVMIVDLLRNDLSRIAAPGSVNAPSLFEVARHGDVLQMTSTITAELKQGTTLSAVLKAVFPCGSVTGAPKKRSMEIIHELEPKDRGYYCGALGWLDPSGDFALSVPIRTIEIEENNYTKESRFTLGVGAGITIDSSPTQEWEECQIKSSFLTTLPSGVGLFETILVTDRQAQLLDAHLSRMSKSAKSLGIPLHEDELRDVIAASCMPLNTNEVYRLRVDLASDGKLSCAVSAIEPLPERVRLYWAKDLLMNSGSAIMQSGNSLLGYKTTHRKFYDEAWKTAAAQGGFDALFTNELGNVTEGGRSSIFIKDNKSDQWLTPPLSAGLLPGVMRESILTNPQWNTREANLTISDVLNAKEIMLSNALRGLIPAYF